MSTSRIAVLSILLALSLACGCQRKPAVTISVGDTAAETWQKLQECGYKVAKIPLDGRISEMTPQGASKVVAQTIPYDIDGRFVLITQEYTRNTISSIIINEKDSVPSLQLNQPRKPK